jgi:hypothetical protein
LPAASTADDGSFHVRVAVIDRDGGVTVYRPLVTVTNVAPTATITGPDAVGSSGAVTVTVGATDPSPADVLTLTLDWGDGTVETVAAGDVSHTYRAAGTYTARLVARDDDGGESAPATHTLTVAAAPASPPAPPPPPTQTAASSPPLDAKALTFTLAGKGRQLLLSKQQIPVVVNCGGVACTITVAAEIRVKGKRLKLTPLKASLPTGNATPLKLTTTSAQRARIRKLVGRHGTKATLAYTITATDVAGAHVTRTGTIALRRLAAGG